VRSAWNLHAPDGTVKDDDISPSALLRWSLATDASIEIESAVMPVHEDHEESKNGSAEARRAAYISSRHKYTKSW
jgi:hypothetical protein